MAVLHDLLLDKEHCLSLEHQRRPIYKLIMSPALFQTNDITNALSNSTLPEMHLYDNQFSAISKNYSRLNLLLLQH